MKYTKPPLTVEEQADQLIGRGLLCDRGVLIERLRVVSYYRLSGYWYPFRKPDAASPGRRLDDLEPGTDFDTVWSRYVFDRRLRLLVMDAIERIEVAIRTAVAYHHAHAHGPFAYATDPASLPSSSKNERDSLLGSIQRERSRSAEPFVQHFQSKYGSDHSDLPIWMAIEIMPFGAVLTMYRGCPKTIRTDVAKLLSIHETVLESWFLTLHAVRNICAHHSRLWNRVLGVKPKIPVEKNDARWHKPVPIGNERIFGVLTICKHSMDCLAPQSQWPQRLLKLINDSPGIPTADMGFPTDWLKCPIWTGISPSTKGGANG